MIKIMMAKRWKWILHASSVITGDRLEIWLINMCWKDKKTQPSKKYGVQVTLPPGREKPVVGLQPVSRQTVETFLPRKGGKQQCGNTKQLSTFWLLQWEDSASTTTPQKHGRTCKWVQEQKNGSRHLWNRTENGLFETPVTAKLEWWTLLTFPLKLVAVVGRRVDAVQVQLGAFIQLIGQEGAFAAVQRQTDVWSRKLLLCLLSLAGWISWAGQTAECGHQFIIRTPITVCVMTASNLRGRFF